MHLIKVITKIKKVKLKKWQFYELDLDWNFKAQFWSGMAFVFHPPLTTIC